MCSRSEGDSEGEGADGDGAIGADSEAEGDALRRIVATHSLMTRCGVSFGVNNEGPLHW